MTPQLRWYYKNRETAIARAKAWREAHPDRYREIQRDAKRRKRAKPMETHDEVPFTLPASVMTADQLPNNYDAAIHGSVAEFKRRYPNGFKW